MRLKCKPFAEELVAYVFHPNRLERIIKLYSPHLDLQEYLEYI